MRIDASFAPDQQFIYLGSVSMISRIGLVYRMHHSDGSEIDCEIPFRFTADDSECSDCICTQALRDHPDVQKAKESMQAGGRC